MKASGKTPLDYIESKEELVPVQVRLPGTLLSAVKQKLQENGMTFTDLVKGACAWYLHAAEAEAHSLVHKQQKKKKT
jgi:predicted DNA binding CopG/RHH family protein